MIESFGLPIIEGISSGANILSSNIKSITEVAETSIKFNPKKNQKLKWLLKTLLDRYIILIQN